MTSVALLVEELPPAERATALYNELMLRALELTRDPHDAEDLGQDVLLRCLERPPEFLDQKTLHHWLRSVMRNLHIDRVRRRKEILDDRTPSLRVWAPGRRRNDSHLQQRGASVRVPPL